MTENVALPSIGGLQTLAASEWRALGLRLREIGLDGKCAAAAGGVGEGLPPALRAPLQHWHLRRMTEPAGYAMRLFLAADTLAEHEAAEALGGRLLARLLSAGLAVRGDGGHVSSPFQLSVASGIYVFSDDLAHGGEAAMGPSDATALLCRAAYAGRPAGRVLDLGCGAGTVALVLARHAESAIATDINPRAVALARMNAAINGIDNVEFRLGNGFEPVAGLRFDLIASQPPFVARPPAAAPASFLFGGVRGDELPLGIVAGAGRHLEPRGRAVIVAEWPELEGNPAAERIAASAGDARVLDLSFPPQNPDYACGMYAAAEARATGDSYRAAALRWRDHFAAQGIDGLRLICTVIERSPHGPWWRDTLELPPERSGEITGLAIGRWMAARDLLHGSPDTLWAATLRLADGAVFSREYSLEAGARPAYYLRLPDSPERPVELSEDSLLLVSLLQNGDTVRQAVEEFAARKTTAFDEVARGSLAAIRQLVLSGAMA